MPTTVSQNQLERLAQLIREHRSRTGESVNSLAQRADMPPSVLSCIINGTYNSSPSLERVTRICEAIGVEIEFKLVS